MWNVIIYLNQLFAIRIPRFGHVEIMESKKIKESVGRPVALPIGEQTILFGANQQFRRFGIGQGQMKKLIDISFAVPDTDHDGLGRMFLGLPSGLKTFQRFIAFLARESAQG
jgi:hypothetical protein